MGLKFAPLAWIYHDGWSWKQSKTLVSYDQNGNRHDIDASKNYHQRGHCHLFLPTVPYSSNGSSLAYWGEQTYKFNVVDEWGPNSKDPSQSRSVKLIGKPIWYVYVEEYWRRFYAQPWDMVDETCTLPMNQEITYTKRNKEEYCHELISHAPLYSDTPVTVIDYYDRHYTYEYSGSSTYEKVEKTTEELDGSPQYDSTLGRVRITPVYLTSLGLFDYMTCLRRKAAMQLFVTATSYSSSFKEWLVNKINGIRANTLSFDGSSEEIVGLLPSKDSMSSIIRGSSCQYTPIWYSIAHSSGYHYYAEAFADFIQPSVSQQQSSYPTMPLSDSIPDALMIEFLYTVNETDVMEVVGDREQPTGEKVTMRFIDAFNQFYSSMASRFNGYVDSMEMIESFMELNNITFKEGCRTGQDGTIMVPDEKTTGHVGIKFDASKPCHSLGPFMEGGEFYFFNTVVNRTMPCEYWLDEGMKTRQYFIKKGWNGFATVGDDTAGGQTWTFEGDDTRFHWVIDVFSETADFIKDYQEDTPNIQKGYGGTHRLQHLTPLEANEYYNCYGMNAKRLKDDRSIHVDGLNQNISDNSQVLHDRFATGTSARESEIVEEKPSTVTYGDNGWTVNEDDEEQVAPTPSTHQKKLNWELYGWTGWYAKNELVKCDKDGKWYRRTWSPMRYDEGSPLVASYSKYSGVSGKPYWSVSKRQNFPNPSPFLCNNEDDSPRYSTDGITGDLPVTGINGGKMIQNRWNQSIYDNDESNRIHLLHWEYASYFNLVRTYPKNFHQGEESTIRKHFFMFSIEKPTSNSRTVSFMKVQISQNGEYELTYYDPSNPAAPGGSSTNPHALQNMLIDEVPADIETLMEEYEEKYGTITDIETEHEVFMDWISSLGHAYFMQYEDREVMYHGDSSSASEITESMIQPDGTTYKHEVLNNKGEVIAEYIYPLPDPIYTVSYTDSVGTLYGYDYKNQTYLTFNEFSHVWTPISDDERRRLKLDGDMPRRNSLKYSLDEKDNVYPQTSNSAENTAKTEWYATMSNGLGNEAAPSLLCSEFFPVVDEKTRQYNESRQQTQPKYTLSPLDEIGDEIEQSQWDSMTDEQKKAYLRWYNEKGDPIDPYRNGTRNPLTTWKKYFDHREVFTIPEDNVVGGDKGITNMEGSPNYPNVHPRETSFNHEDGARRHYPDDMYVSPIIEYQKVIRKNYERLPGKEAEEEFLQENWKTDKNGNWGDGFEIEVSIPWTLNYEVQSPFSESDNVTRPIGEYCHDCVKPEDRMRHHLEFYDSLDQIRKYDFPNYVDIMRAFEATTVWNTIQPAPSDEQSIPTQVVYDEELGDITVPVESVETPADGNAPLYREDFNSKENNDKFRHYEGKQKPLGLIQYCFKRKKDYNNWQAVIDEYWKTIDAQHHYSNTPVVRNRDCNGNETVENSFVTLQDGSHMWREQTTNLLPDEDKIEYADMERTQVGYKDSKGNYIKGGGAVKFNDPYPENHDGKWYEECLGAVVKAKCVLILEDALGYRWKQEVTATALQADQPIRGSDYDG